MMQYIEEKIWLILLYFTFIFVQFIFSFLLGLDLFLMFTLFICSMILLIIYLVFDYKKIKKQNKKIEELVDNLEEKYLVSEVIKRPKRIEDKGYYYALKKSSKAMNDEIAKINHKYQDYKEYIESFVHEVKTPIAALLLYCDNHKNIEIKEDIKKIDNLVEQILYYARTENPEKDYFIKSITISDIVHQVLMENKDYFFKHKTSIETNNLDIKVATDEKWLIFVLNQIVNNAIKYMDKENKIINFNAQEEKNKVTLSIKDNGCGIKDSDLTRVFEKGFTGSDRKKSRSTGIGLYLAKNICLKLGLEIYIKSEYQKWTQVDIVFPKTNYNKMDE